MKYTVGYIHNEVIPINATRRKVQLQINEPPHCPVVSILSYPSQVQIFPSTFWSQRSKSLVVTHTSYPLICVILAQYYVPSGWLVISSMASGQEGWQKRYWAYQCEHNIVYLQECQFFKPVFVNKSSSGNEQEVLEEPIAYFPLTWHGHHNASNNSLLRESLYRVVT
jgi:hypothetical protein